MLMLRAIRCLACLLGAAGVAAAAAAAHGGADTRTAAGAQVLLIHAAAVLALTAGTPSRILIAATAALEIGTAFFAGDMATRVLTGHALFPMAAPAGGILLIVAWLVAGVATAITRP